MVANIFTDASIFLSIFARAGFFKLCIASWSSLYTSVACCSGVNCGSTQCCGNRSNDAEMRYALVSGS